MTGDATQSAEQAAEPTPPAEPASAVPERVQPPVEIAPEEQTAPAPISPAQESSQAAAMETSAAETNTPKSQPTSIAPSVPSEEATVQPAPQVQASKWSQTDRAHAVAAQVGKREKRLDKIVEHVRTRGAIGNDDIEKLLHVSDATASRYGSILVARGALERKGKGRSARYILKS